MPKSIVFALLVLALSTAGADAFVLTGASASSQAFPSLGPTKAIDGNSTTFWSSAGHTGPSYTEWIAVEMDTTIPLAGVTLTPRVSGSTTLAYPRDYSVEYSYDDAGIRWFPVAGASYTNVPSPSEPVTHSFSGKILARRVRIKATRLGQDDYGNYYFQLAEIQPIEGNTVFPFATSVGGSFDARLNMMWSIFGSIQDGTNAVYTLGHMPAWHEWLAVKYGWSYSTESINSQLKWWIASFAQSNDGYIWSWLDREPWATNPPPYHNENNAKYILGVWRVWTWQRNDQWFNQIDNTRVANPAVPMRPGMSDISYGLTNRQKARLAMQYLEESLKGNLGGITIEDNGMNHTGTVTGSSSNYWDNWKFGYKNAYDNIYYYAALEAMAQMEEYWGDGARAAQLRSYRSGCRTAYDAAFWSSTKGRYVGTVDRNGVTWDFGSTFVNLEALAYGLGDAAKAQQVFKWLNGERIIAGETSTGADIYYWKFAPRANTIKIESIGPPYWWYDLGGAIRVDTASARWPNHLENGGAIFYTSYYDLMARIKYLGADNALARLNVILNEFDIDQLRRDPAAPGSAPWQLGIIGEFPESGLVPCVMVYGFAGIEPDIRGLNIAPRLPTGWTSLKVRQVTWAGTLLDITVEPTKVTFDSAPTSSRTIYVHQASIAPGETKSFGYDPEGNVRLLLVKGPAANQAPVVSAGDDQAIKWWQTATLDGTVSDDGLPNPPGAVTTAWSKVSGPGTVSFGNPGAVDTTVSFSLAGVYALRLTADDGELFGSDDVAITVTSGIPGDFDEDLDVDQEDFGHFQVCFSGLLPPYPPGCRDADLDNDMDVDQDDYRLFLRCVSGPNHPANLKCAE